MTDDDLARRIAALRQEGHSPKEIARALRVRPAVVAAQVRTIAADRSPVEAEPAVVGCWVSPHWNAGLAVEGHPEWLPADEETTTGGQGLVSVIVARRRRYDKVSACGYLVDVYCLGVKEVLGPRVLAERDLAAFVEQFFQAYDSPPLVAPVDLARHLVLGAVEYARGLGFEPAADFGRAADHLGPALTDPSAIRFGRDGKPFFVQGPNDDAASIMRTLERSVGEGKFEFMVGASPSPR